MANLKSDMIKKHGTPVAAPVPAYLNSGEERFRGDVLYTQVPEQKINYYAAGQPWTGRGTIPMYALINVKRFPWEASIKQGKHVGGPKPLHKNLNTACPVDESEPRPSYFLKAECKLHGEKNKETGKITPCKPEELPAACRKTVANLKLKPVSAETKHVGFHDDYCTEEEEDCCTLHRELPDCEEVITQGTPSERLFNTIKNGPVTIIQGTGEVFSKEGHAFPWIELQDAKECLVQHHYHAISKNGEYIFVKKLGKENLLTADRRKAAGLPLQGGSSIWTEKWPAGPKGTATRRAPLGKLYAAALEALPHHVVNGESKVLDGTYKGLGQSDVAEWCRLNTVQVALPTMGRVLRPFVRHVRDGDVHGDAGKFAPHTFENITKEPLFVSKAGKLHSVKSKTGYKHVDRASKPKVDAWEYVNRQPALTLSKLAGELDWFEAEKLTTEKVRKQYFNHFDYFAKAKRAAEIRERLEQREFIRVYDRSAQQWIPRIGPNAEEEAQEWGSDKHIYTTWVLKTNKSRFHVHRFALDFAVKVNETRQRVRANRELTKNYLDPLRPVSTVLADWAAATKKFLKETKLYCKERSCYCSKYFTWIEHKPDVTTEEAVTITFPSSRHCSGGLRETSTVHDLSLSEDLGLRYILRDPVVTRNEESDWERVFVPESERYAGRVPMADRMGAFYNVKEGVWQPYHYQERWQPVEVPAHQLQRTRLEQLFRGDLECIEDVPFGWTVPTVELKSNSFDPDGWLVYVKAKELHNVHFKPSAELATDNECCTCWHCGEKFLTYYSLQTHVDKHYTCETFEEFYCTLFDAKGKLNLKLQHDHYGAVKFIRILSSDENRAWVRKTSSDIGIDISTLRFKNGESVKGSKILKRLTKKPYEPAQEPSRIVTMSEAQTETLHNYLCAVYPDSLVKVLRNFRGYRREQGYTLLTENTYQFLETLDKRQMKGEELGITIAKDTTEESVRWLLKIGNTKMSLGVIDSPTRKDVPSKQEVLEHCTANARETWDNPKLTAEWAAWAIKAHICRLDGCTWYDGGDDVLSKFPTSDQPSSFLAKLSITDAEPRGTLPEEEDYTE